MDKRTTQTTSNTDNYQSKSKARPRISPMPLDYIEIEDRYMDMACERMMQKLKQKQKEQQK